MIDARDQSMTATATKNRRRSTTSRGGRKARATSPKKRVKKLAIDRVFSQVDENPYDAVKWDKRSAEITDEGGNSIFKQDNVEVPESWSLLATKVVVSK